MELGLYNHLTQLLPFQVERRNTLVLGSMGTGKSTLLVRLALNDIYDGLPVCFVDPHGSAIDHILKHIPANRQKDVILFDPSRQPFAFNVFANIKEDKHNLFASTLLETVKGVWGYENVATPVLDQYFRAIIHTALASKGSTFLSLKFLLTNDSYRKQLLDSIDDTIIKDFWNDYETLTAKEQRQDVSSTVNKLRAFLFAPLVRNCLDQKKNCLLFKDKIVLCALRTRELGTENACLLGALVLASLYIEDVEQHLYIDGSRFGNAILGSLMSSCPSVSTVVSVQFLDQLSKDFQKTLLGGVGQVVAFRTSHHDSEVLSPDFNLNRDHFALNELKPYTAMACIDGIPTELTMSEHTYPETNQAHKIIARCKSQYTAPIETVEARIKRFV